MREHINQNEVCAVIPCYDPAAGFDKRLNQIAKQVGQVIVVDDSGLPLILGYLNIAQNIEVIHNSFNYGQARSLNIGIEQAKKQHFNYIITLDDDTEVYENLVERTIFYYIKINGITNSKLGIIGLSWNIEDGRKPHVRETLASWHVKRGIITSGSFFSIKDFEIIGYFRDDFVIDYVDYDFCLRARRKNLLVVKVDEIGFNHGIGISKKHIEKTHPDYGLIRQYYSARNKLRTALENVMNDPLFSVYTIVSLGNDFLKFILHYKARRTELTYFCQGIRDGILSKLGKYAY